MLPVPSNDIDKSSLFVQYTDKGYLEDGFNFMMKELKVIFVGEVD